MSDDTAPERIWAANKYWPYPQYWTEQDIGSMWWEAARVEAEGVEYIRADLGSFYQEKDIDALQDRIAALEAERDRLREALEQYAGATDAWGIKYEPIDDKGAVARAALKGDTDT